MTTFDFLPLHQSAIGFDHLSSLLDSISTNEKTASGYPPYNIELIKDDAYRISMAVAGFVDEDIMIEVENNALVVSADKPAVNKETKRNYLHCGIAERNFKRQFKLADHVKVINATLESGLLHIDLERETPEMMKPRQIAINGNSKKLLKSA